MGVFLVSGGKIMLAWDVAIPYARSVLFSLALLLSCCCARVGAAARMPELLPQARCYAESKNFTGGFQRISSPEFAFRFTSCDTLDSFAQDTVYWIRFRPDLLPDTAVLGLRNARSGELALFTPTGPENWLFSVQNTATDAPLSPQFPFPALRLPNELSQNASGPDAQSYAYLQLRSVHAPAKDLRVFNADTFYRLTWQYVLALGLALGALAAALGFAFCCWLTQRSRLQFLYIAFLFALFCYHVANSGLLALTDPVLAAVVSARTTIFAYAVLICGAAYSRFFLETKRHVPLVDLLIRLCPFPLLAGLVCLVFGADQAATYVGFATALLLLGLCGAGALAAVRGNLPGARLYLSAWPLLVTGVLFAVADNLFSFSHGFALHHIQLFAAALAGLPLSLALVRRSALVSGEQENISREKDQQQVEITDELTGLYNKRFFESSLENAIESSRLTGSPLSLLLLNVDNFRRFNETYGPPQADKMLSTLGELIRKGVRAQDVPCRFDNEEFAIILPGTTENDAMHAAERFRKSFANLFFHPDPSIRVNSTLNISVITCASDDTPNSVFERAGQALYKAKLDNQHTITSAKQN